MTSDGNKIIFTNFVFGDESHQYRDKESGKTQTIPAGNVLRIEKQTGTEAGKWALWLGLSGLVGSTLGVLQGVTDVERLGGSTEKVNVAPIIIGFTAGAALIGAAIGAGKKKYQTIYTNPEHAGTTFISSMRIGITSTTGSDIGIGLQCRF